MSFSVKKNAIKLTRGDTFIGQVDLFTPDGEPYTPGESDEVRFALKHSKMDAMRTRYIDPEPLLLITIPNETLVLRIESADTKELEFGQYVYDVQITFPDGTVDTFITEAPFTLAPEVE